MRTWTPEQIKAFRKELNLYQREFGSMVGVTQRYVIYLEKGVRTPSKTLRLLLDRIEKEKEKGG